MVTSFTLTDGYHSTEFAQISKEELYSIAIEVGKNQEKLYAKCREYNVPEIMDCGCTLKELVARYANLPTDDLTCNFIDKERCDYIKDDYFAVHQSCCGGTCHRQYREQICKAFGVLVLDECYKRGHNVNFESS